MDKFDYLQAALKDPWVRAYLKTIQHNEGTDRGVRGYATYFRYYDNGETPEETLRSYICTGCRLATASSPLPAAPIR